MRFFKTQSHVQWNCKYHVVIVPKYRKHVLYGPLRQEIGKILRKLASRKEVEVIEGTACPDHIHLVLSIPPKFSVAHIIGFMKGKSAIEVHNRFTKRKRRSVTQKSFWARGYFVSTVGIDEETIKKYVREQWERDQFHDGPQLDLHWN